MAAAKTSRQRQAVDQLIQAVEQGDVHATQQALQHVNAEFVDQITHNGWPLLLRAKTNDVLRALLEHGCDPNARKPGGGHALHYCSTPDEALLLLHFGAAVDPAAEYGETPLHTAVFFGDARLVDVFIRHGADVNRHCDEGWTALHHAVIIDRGVEIPTLLLEAGASPNARSLDGQTPLMWAASHSKRLVTLLLRYGADTDLRCHSGATAAAYARGRALWEVAAMLDRHTVK